VGITGSRLLTRGQVDLLLTKLVFVFYFFLRLKSTLSVASRITFSTELSALKSIVILLFFFCFSGRLLVSRSFILSFNSPLHTLFPRGIKGVYSFSMLDFAKTPAS
jgi:hypothetical protein